MRGYRNGWTVVVTVLSAIAFDAAVGTTGWVPAVVVLVGMASVGGLFGLVWYDEEPEARRRITVRFALWFGAGSILLVGFTPVIYQWVVLLLLALGGSAPDLVERCLGWRAAHRPPAPLLALDDLSYRELERRWRTTTSQVRSKSIPAQEVAALVAQRGRLLDELERRDPARFEVSLVRAGWRESQRS